MHARNEIFVRRIALPNRCCYNYKTSSIHFNHYNLISSASISQSTLAPSSAAIFAAILNKTRPNMSTSKRGICFSKKEGPSPADLEMLAEHGVTWWYNWGKHGVASSMEFVPMLWNLSNLNEKANEIEAYKTENPAARYLLVLNEPNHRNQANTTPQKAAERWPELEDIASRFELAIVGPQLCYGRMEGFEKPDVWLETFIAEYRSRNDNRDPRIDALGYHFYGSHGLRSHLDRLKRFQKPIWVTEFAHYHAVTIEEQMLWMTKAVALCEERPDVERYAWFIGRKGKKTIPVGTEVEARPAGDNNICLLGSEDGMLNELGEHYVKLPVQHHGMGQGDYT
jgi:hypothetical protein